MLKNLYILSIAILISSSAAMAVEPPHHQREEVKPTFSPQNHVIERNKENNVFDNYSYGSSVPYEERK